MNGTGSTSSSTTAQAANSPDRRENSRKVEFKKAARVYHLGNPDCVWYYNGPGPKELHKAAMRDKYLPFFGLELLLLSFAGCSGSAIAYLLRKMGKNISGLRVKAKGVRRNQPPIKFEKIFLEFLLSSMDTKDADIQKAIQLAEALVCPVWQMIENNVEVTTEYKITELNNL